MKFKTKNKNENEKQNENKNENKNQNEFSFWFFVFLLFKSFCIFVHSSLPSGAIDDQLSLDWPRSAIVFLSRNMATSLIQIYRIQ